MSRENGEIKLGSSNKGTEIYPATGIIAGENEEFEDNDLGCSGQGETFEPFVADSNGGRKCSVDELIAQASREQETSADE